MSGGEELAVRTLDADQARALTETIKADLGSLAANIAAAFKGRAWEPLGYASWGDYTAAEFTLDQYRLPRGVKRDEVLATLADAGMSQREMAAATGLNQSTISRALGSGDANASPDADEWRTTMEELFDCYGWVADSPPDRAQLAACAAWLADDFLTDARDDYWSAGPLAGVRAEVVITAALLCFRCPLHWSPVVPFLRGRSAAEVRVLVNGILLAYDSDAHTLRYAADVLTIIGGEW